MNNDDFDLEPIAASLPFDEPAASDKAATPARCESCGGPAEDGDLCGTCKRAFDAVLRATPLEHSEPPVQPFERPFETAAVPDAALAVESDAPALHSAGEREGEVVAAAAVTEPKPAVAASSGRALRTLGTIAAAAIVIVTIGVPLSRLWLSRQTIVVSTAAAPDAKAPAPTATSSAPVAKEEPSAPVAPPPAAAAPVRAAPRPAVAAKPLKPRAVPVAQPAIAAPELAVETPSIAALPAPLPVAVEAPAPPPPAAPVGPFYESPQVDRAPQVTARVEPRIPDNLPEQARKEILIARVLVSQSGHPAMVNLLRRSKSGPALDAAVIDAVKRWSFEPAIKRGQAVSCFLNVGVPVAGTEAQ